MKNRKLLLVVSLLLALTMSLGGTLAYLTDTDSDVNVMTLGNVDIIQLENGKEENGFAQGAPLYPAYYENDIDWAKTPGVMDKEVTVKNNGSSAAYVRTWFAFEAGNMSYGDFQKYILLNMNAGASSPWEWAWDTSKTYSIKDSAGDTAQYYIAVATLKEALQAGNTTAASLYDVAMSKDANNAQVTPMGAEYTVLTLTQAMQTVNFEDKSPADALNIGFETAGTNGVDFAKHPWTEGVDTPDASTIPGTSIRLVKAGKQGGTVYLNSADDFWYLSKLDSDAEWNAVTGLNGAFYWDIVLNCDVDLENKEWTPVSIETFAGFDGNGHTISNLKINSAEKRVGLFSNSLNNDSGICPISNLTIDGANVTATAEEAVVGVVIGYATTPISNVTVKNATVTATKYAGGIVGKSQSSLTNCAVYDSEIKSAGKEVGGIVGFLDIGENATDAYTVYVSNCTVQDTKVTGTEEVGGIVGRAYARNETTIKITGYTTNNVTVTATKNTMVGNVVGNKYNNSNVIVDGEIKADLIVPGTSIWLVKATKPQEGGTVLLNSPDDFRYLQTLNDDWKNITKSEDHDHYYYQSAWIVELNSDVDLNNELWTPVTINQFGGFDGNNHTISNLKIVSSDNKVGLFKETLNNDSGKCPISNLVINGASVTGNEVVGVVAGYAPTPITNVTVKNATVNGAKYVGGIVGKGGADLINCAVIDSEIISTGKEVGGIIGFLTIESSSADDYVAHVSNCGVSNTTISGTEEVGGIMGRAYPIKGSIEISNCTVADNVTVTATNNIYVGEILGRDYDEDKDVVIK